MGQKQSSLMWQTMPIGAGPQKRFTTIGKGAERKAKKKDRPLKSNHRLPPNEVLKGCFDSTLKTIESNPIVSTCKSLIQVGKVLRFLDPSFLRSVQLENSLIQWKSLGGGLLGLFVPIRPLISSLNAQLTQKIRMVNSAKEICDIFCKFV